MQNQTHSSTFFSHEIIMTITFSRARFPTPIAPRTGHTAYSSSMTPQKINNNFNNV